MPNQVFSDEADQFFQSMTKGLENSPQSPVRGQLLPINHTVLSSGLDGKLKRLPVRVGNDIAQGEIIAEFDCDIEQAENKIGQARETVAKENLDINKRLDELKSVSSRDLSVSVADFSISQAEFERSSAMLAQCVISAPFGGTITEKFVQAHQYVKKGEEIVELVDTHNLEVEMILPSMNLNQYQPGKVFTLIIDETGQEAKARIDRVVNVIDPVSQTIRVIGVLVDNPQGLMPGMSGIVIF